MAARRSGYAALAWSAAAHAAVVAAVAGLVRMGGEHETRPPPPSVVWMAEFRLDAPEPAGAPEPTGPADAPEPIEASELAGASTPAAAAVPAEAAPVEPDAAADDERAAPESLPSVDDPAPPSVEDLESSRRIDDPEPVAEAEPERSAVDDVPPVSSESDPEASVPDAPPPARRPPAYVVAEEDLDEAWRAALEQSRAQGEYPSFPLDDVVPAPRPAEPGPEESVFDRAEEFGSAPRSVMSPGKARSHFGQRLARLCNALTGGFGFMGLVSFCADRQETAKLFAHLKPAYLRARPECVEVDAPSPVADGGSAVNCRLVVDEQ